MEFIHMSLKMIVGLIVLLIIIKIMGNKELSQVTPLDMIFIVVIADFLGGITMDKELKVEHLVFSIVLWVILIYLLEKITKKSTRLEKLIKGKPTVLIENGEIDRDVMQKERMTQKDVETLLRSKDVFDIEEVELAILEISGELSVKRKK